MVRADSGILNTQALSCSPHYALDVSYVLLNLSNLEYTTDAAEYAPRMF